MLICERRSRGVFVDVEFRMSRVFFYLSWRCWTVSEGLILLRGVSGRRGSFNMADHGKIHVISNAAAFNEKLEEAERTGKIVVVDFTATWCGPCRLMAPIFSELSKKYENLIFLKVDVDEVQDITSKWEVRAMPTFIFIKQKNQVDKIVGANKDELEKKVKHYATTA